MSLIKSTFTGRELKNLGSVKINNNTNIEDLESIGFNFRALDGNSLLTNFANQGGYLSDNLVSFLSNTIRVGTQAKTIDDILGLTVAGSWEDEEIALRVTTATGKALQYGDLSNIPLASYVPQIEKRNVVRFEQGFLASKLETLRDEKAGFNTIDEKRIASIESLEHTREEVGFRGFGSNKTYGLLNDPSLVPYKTTVGKWLTTGTFEQITTDIMTMFSDIEVRSGGVVKDTDNITLVIPTGYLIALTKANPTNMSETVKARIMETFPNLRIISTPYFKRANGSSDVVYMIVENGSDGNASAIQVVPAKYNILGSINDIKGYKEDSTNALAGVFIQKPWLISRYSILA